MGGSAADYELRDPTSDELAVIAFALSGDQPGAERLRSQMPNLRVRANCDCGCPSISLHHPDGPQKTHSTTDAGPWPGHISIVEDDNQIGGVILRVTATGFLCDLEVYAYEGTITTIPPVANLRLESDQA
ncbi:MAG: hypothetical protein AAGK32_16190 [Actinomycetota bacterium]